MCVYIYIVILMGGTKLQNNIESHYTTYKATLV